MYQKSLVFAAPSCRTRLSRLTHTIGILVAGWVGTGAYATPIDLGISNDADYVRFVDAIRATEYVREDYIIQSRNPRVVASVTALSAYAQINPLASQAQLDLFVSSFDASIQIQYPGDPDLRRSANFMTALRFTVVDELGLNGTNTHVGLLAAQMLGVVVPAPDNFDATRRRMVRFGQGLAMRYTHQSAFSELLVSGFFGVTQDGVDRPQLSIALNQYLTDAGYEPSYGFINSDSRFDDVNMAICTLPADFKGYTLALNQSLVSNTLVLMVDAQTALVQAEIDARILTLNDAVAAEPTIQDGFAQGQDQIIVDDLAADLREQLQETSYARASMFGATFLLGQSPLDELGNYSALTLTFNATLLETSDTVAEMQIGLGVLTNLATLTAGIASGDPISAVGGMFGLVSDAIGIADHTGAFGSTPSVDRQIYDQLIALRVQVEAMRLEMHERFDRIEQQLDFMYDQMADGFNALGEGIGGLGNQNQAILREMHIVRSQLSQLESALFGLAEDILLTDLTDAANTVLDFRDENNIDLAYANENPNFISASEDFFTFATITAQSQAFAGSRSSPQVTLTTAYQHLSINPIARHLNDLAVLPGSLGLPPLTFTTLSGPEPWAQAASAYTQLVKESPWYFAFRYQSQLEDYLSDPKNESLPELDEIIEDGEALVSIGNSARNEALFDALVDLYRQQVSDLQSEINTVWLAEMTTRQLRWESGEELVMIDLWNTDGIQLDIEKLFAQLSPGHQPAFNEMDDSSPNWGPNGTQFEIDPSLSLFERARIVSGEDTDHVYRAMLFEYLNQLDINPKYVHEIRWDAYVHRSIRRAPAFEVIHRIDVNPDPFIEEMQEIHSRRIGSSMEVMGDPNGFFRWVQFTLYPNESDPQNCAYQLFLTGGGGQDIIWSSLEQGMPFGSVDNLVLEFDDEVSLNDFEWIQNGCGNWPLMDNLIGFRIHPLSDTASSLDNNQTINGHIFEFLTQYREGNIRPLINGEFGDPLSPISLILKQLDNTAALLNAYITLAAPEAVSRSEILRSALRATPGQSQIGLRANDVLQLILDFQSQGADRDPRSPADPDFDFHVLDQILNDRIDFVHDEINRAIAMPLESAPYIEWMLAELKEVRGQVFAPARGDLYATDSSLLIVDASQGVMANDILQEYRPIVVDPLFGTPPTNGDLTLNEDGSFEYLPDPGFAGTDTFTYRLIGTIVEGTPIPADGQFVSDSATVVISVEASGACSEADFNSDGRLNFFDVSSFLQAFTAENPEADFTNDGRWNFFDVSAFLTAFSAGCP